MAKTKVGRLVEKAIENLSWELAAASVLEAMVDSELKRRLEYECCAHKTAKKDCLPDKTNEDFCS